MKTTKQTNIIDVMRELAEFKTMQEEIKFQIESLQDEVKEWMTENDVDEVVTDDGKATWREVISNRFDSTSFKKVHSDLYQAFVSKTTCKRFTFH